MKPISSDYKTQIKAFGKELDSKIIFGNTELGSEQLNSVTPHYESSILKSVMKQLDIDSNVEIPVGTEVNYKFGVKVGNEYEYVDYGNYIVYKTEKQEDSRSWKITCYDKMLYAMKDYESLGLTYPVTIKEYLIALCDKLGLEFANENDNFVNSDKPIQSELYLDADGNSLDYTFRDVLDELAQVTASVICINNNDELEIRYVNNTGTEATAEGTDLTLANVDEGTDISFDLKGNTYQETTTGKNFFNNQLTRAEGQGNTNTVSETVINTGKRLTSSDETAVTINRFLAYAVMDLTNYVGSTIRMKANFTASGSNKGRYLLGLCNADGSNRTVKSSYADTSGTEISFVVPTLSGSQTYLLVNLYVNTSSGTVVADDYVDYTNMIITIDNSDMTYEPYTYGPTPNPNYPQEVETVSGRQDIQVAGKNLFSSELEIGSINNTTGLDSPDSRCIRSKSYISVAPNTTYTISNILSYNCLIYEYDKYNRIIQYTGNYASPKTFTTTNDTHYLRIRSSAGGNQNDLSGKYQIEIGNEATTFEAYKGNNYEINLGKNLLNMTDGTYTANGITAVVSGGTITLNGTAGSGNSFINIPITPILMKTGVSYMFSANNKQTVGGDASSSFACMRLRTSSADVSSSDTLFNVVDSYKQLNYGQDYDFRYLRIRTASGLSYNNFIIYPQLELGVVKTNYSAYKEPIELCKIGNYQDKIYKEDGKWYIYKAIGKVVLNGTETWSITSAQLLTNTSYFNSNVIDGLCKNNVATLFRSNYFKPVQTLWNNDEEGIQLTTNTNNIRLRINTSTANSVDSFKTWLGSHNTSLYYVLNVPTTTEITDGELLQQLEAVRLVEGQNNVAISSSNLSSPLTLTYTSQLDEIDEEYLKDVNVNFGEKYGPVNSVVFSRSAESDNIYEKDDASILENGLTEIKISDNQILNGNNRDEFMPQIFNKLNGLTYYLNDFVSTGLTFYELMDRYKVKVDNNYYRTIMFNDEANITQGLSENVHADAIEESETDYTKADKTDRRIKQAFIIVDKQNQEINSVVRNIDNLTNMVDSQGNDIEALGTQLTQNINSITANITSIQSTLSNGVNLVKTTSVTIDDEGLNVSTDTSKISTTMTNNTFKIVPKGSTEPLAFFGYDETTDTSVAEMDNLTVRTYFVAGNHRTEKYTTGRTGVFYIGG